MPVKKRFILFLIFIIFCLSLTTFILILNYLDPYDYTYMAITFIITSFIFSLTSFFTIFLYFIKKIYFRGNVYIFHVLSSFRQSFFISLFFLSLIFFYNIGAPIIVTGFFTFLILFFVELFIKNQKV